MVPEDNSQLLLFRCCLLSFEWWCIPLASLQDSTAAQQQIRGLSYWRQKVPLLRMQPRQHSDNNGNSRSSSNSLYVFLRQAGSERHGYSGSSVCCSQLHRKCQNGNEAADLLSDPLSKMASLVALRFSIRPLYLVNELFLTNFKIKN